MSQLLLVRCVAQSRSCMEGSRLARPCVFADAVSRPGARVEGRGGRAQLLEKATGIGVVHGQLGTGVEKNKAQVCGRGL